MRRLVLVTGASTGLGRAIAGHLAKDGYLVFGTSRNPDAQLPAGVTLSVMDVTSDESVARAIEKLLSQTNGRIDVVVNNAGIGYGGPIEGHSTADALNQIDTNLLGAVRVCRNVLPAMRAQNEGLIINMGSMASVVPMPMQGMYSASKAGLAAMTHALRLELASMNVDVVLVEPSNYRTPFTVQRLRVGVPPAYATMTEHALSAMAAEEMNGNDPDEVARLVSRIVRARRRRAVYRVGPWMERLSVSLSRFMPRRMLDAIMTRHYLSGK